MPVTVRNTDILFNDGTTQSTAGGALTTVAVLNAYAASGLADVGTYAIGGFNTGGAAAGLTVAGSSISYASGGNNSAQGNLAIFSSSGGPGVGTWRRHSYQRSAAGTYAFALFLRIV
jgi:hypothetical protein